MTKQIKLERMIDHTILKPEATETDIIKLCEEAKQYNFASVCVNSSNVPLAFSLLNKTPVKVCTVVGFPLGASTTATKIFEAKEAVENGATEIDMVINIGKLKSKDYDYVQDDIRLVKNAIKDKAILKVIIETCLLTDEEKQQACFSAVEAKADFVKTSTGFSKSGATVEDIKLMKEVVRFSNLGIKASGGVKTLEDAEKLIDAGATRIGTSSGVSICKCIEGATLVDPFAPSLGSY